jgi:hypothetical protein
MSYHGCGAAVREPTVGVSASSQKFALPGGTSYGLITTGSSCGSRLLHISTSSCLGRKTSSTMRQYSLQSRVSKQRSSPSTPHVLTLLHTRSRLPLKLSRAGKANVPAPAQCLRTHIPRPLPHHPPPALRATLQLTLRPLPRVRSRIRPAGHEGRQGRRSVEHCIRDGPCRDRGFVGKVEGDGYPRMVIDSYSCCSIILSTPDMDQ